MTASTATAKCRCKPENTRWVVSDNREAARSKKLKPRQVFTAVPVYQVPFFSCRLLFDFVDIVIIERPFFSKIEVECRVLGTNPRVRARVRSHLLLVILYLILHLSAAFYACFETDGYLRLLRDRWLFLTPIPLSFRAPQTSSTIINQTTNPALKPQTCVV